MDLFQTFLYDMFAVLVQSNCGLVHNAIMTRYIAALTASDPTNHAKHYKWQNTDNDLSHSFLAACRVGADFSVD